MTSDHTLGISAFLSPLKLYVEVLILIMSWIYSDESLLTILNTSYAISLSLLTWRGSVLVWLSNFLRDEE